MKHEKIEECAIYDVSLVFLPERELKNWRARLRRKGFKLSKCREAYYHPKHWENDFSFGKNDPGDFWIFSDAFKAKTEEAKNYICRVCRE